jgi:hypothetical protein
MPNNDDDLTDEDILKASEAYLTFVQRFGEYVKEMDPVLWSKAREYAADFTKIPGVKVELVDIDEEDVKDDDGTSPEGAD